MWVKHVNGVNLYTDKLHIVYDYPGSTKKNGRVKSWRYCLGCRAMKGSRDFGKLVRNICGECVLKIIYEEG